MHQMHIVTPPFNSLLPAIPVLLAFSLAGRDRPCSATQLQPPSEKRIVDTDASQFCAHLETVNYKGWNAYRLANGLVSLIVVPDIGGRAIQFSLGDKELFFVNPFFAGKVLPESENNPKAGFANYGGDKVWPAPEGWRDDDEWPSIPYFVLDGSRFQAEIVSNTLQEAALRVTSPGDSRTGIQFSRTFHVYAGTTRIRVDEVMRNVSMRQIRWGIWHLVQHDAADAGNVSKPNPELFMYVPLNPHSVYPDGYTKAYGDVRHPSYELIDRGRMLRIHYLYRVGKVAIDSDRGWYAVVNGQKKTCFVETFKYFPGEEYPDHASIESWNDGPGTIYRDPFDQVLKDDPKETPYFFESEVLSPYITLAPGEERLFTVQWSLTGLTPPVMDSRWVGVTSEPFTAVANQKSVNLKGKFGVFSPGELEAIFYDDHGITLLQKRLQVVDPREEVRLDRAVDLPAGTFRISICVRNSSGDNLGFLGNAILH